MTDSNYTHILTIVDRSGSMSANLANVEMASALNNYFSEQAKVEGTCLVDYVQFDDTSETVFKGRPVQSAEAVIEPRGSTALLDAIGNAVTELGKELKALPEARRPGKVQVVIVTDGYENASKRWNYGTVKRLVEDQTNKYDWDFVFLGANIDAPAVGARFGVAASNSMTFNIANHEAVGATSAALSSYTTTYRGTGQTGTFSDEDRKKSMAGKS